MLCFAMMSLRTHPSARFWIISTVTAGTGMLPALWPFVFIDNGFYLSETSAQYWPFGCLYVTRVLEFSVLPEEVAIPQHWHIFVCFVYAADELHLTHSSRTAMPRARSHLSEVNAASPEKSTDARLQSAARCTSRR
jgi:hypothetical protein